MTRLPARPVPATATAAPASPCGPADVSRETMPASRDRRLLAAVGAVSALALFAAACTRPPGPAGWAGPRSFTVGSQHMILAAHKSHLFAFAVPQDPNNPLWEFPPRVRDQFPLSDQGRAALDDLLDGLQLSADQEAGVKAQTRNLNVSGPSVQAVKDAMKATGAPDSVRSRFAKAVDARTKFEKDALTHVEALYGDIGVSADGKTAFVPTFKGFLFSIDTATGHVHWITPVGDEMVGGVAVDGDTIYYGSKGNRVFAAEAGSGRIKWRFRTKGEVWSTPTVDDSTIYATAINGTVYAINKDGSQKWAFTGAGSGIAGRAAVAGGAVFVGSFDNKLYSIDASNGSKNWSFSAGNWFWATPVVDNGVVYAASLDDSVYAVDASAGKAKWGKPFDTGAPVRSAPVIAGGGLVVANRAGQVYKIDLATGQADGSPATAGTRIYANLTSDGAGLIYVSPTSATLVVLDASNGLTTSGTFLLPQ